MYAEYSVDISYVDMLILLFLLLPVFIFAINDVESIIFTMM